MYDIVMPSAVETARVQKSRLYRTVAFMGGSSILAIASVIVYFNHAFSVDVAAEFFGHAELIAITLTPYMISAVIAAITAIGVMTILPAARYVDPSVQLVVRLREIAEGDLSARVRLHTHDQLRDVANELNTAVGSVGNRVAQWKVINRVQWGVLGRIRMAAEHGDCDDVLHFVGEMEKNWDRIAEIERSLTT
jgi:methyl-accepting chemotaxis protein